MLYPRIRSLVYNRVPVLTPVVIFKQINPTAIGSTIVYPVRTLPRVGVSRLWLHGVFWSVYLASEYLANLLHLRPGEHWLFLRATLLSLPALLLATYTITGYVVPRFLRTQRWSLFLLSLLLIGALVFVARVEWQQWVNYLDHGYTGRVPASKLLKNIIRDYSIIALAVCVSIIGDYRRKQVLNQELAHLRAEAEIKLLKGQLHPHFLFNSLNNIYSLALERSALTADSILKLTELLDYLIYRAGQDEVPLAEEVELLENYIGLERLRHDERLQLETDLGYGPQPLLVAPLLLLPFAENCFKHGGPGPDGIFRVSIYLRADARGLDFRVQNTKKPRASRPQTSGGVGLRNIRQRLTLLYPDRHELRIREQDDRFDVALQLRLR